MIHAWIVSHLGERYPCSTLCVREVFTSVLLSSPQKSSRRVFVFREKPEDDPSDYIESARVRGCFHVNTGSFSRKRISIRIPFVSWLYSKTWRIHQGYNLQDTSWHMRCIIISPIRCRYHMDTTFLEYNKDTQLSGYVLVSGYVRILSYSTHCSYPPEGAGRSREWGFSLQETVTFLTNLTRIPNSFSIP